MPQPPYPRASPPPPPPSPTGTTGGGDNRTLMIALSYLWILAVIPLLVEKDDADVQWHAKHGLVLTVLEIILYVVLGVLSLIPVLGCVIAFIPAIIFLAFLVIRIMAIVKGSQLLGQQAHLQAPPKGIAIMQIINIINFDVPNCVLGIVSLVFLGEPELRRYFRG